MMAKFMHTTQLVQSSSHVTKGKHSGEELFPGRLVESYVPPFLSDCIFFAIHWYRSIRFYVPPIVGT